MMEEHKWRYLHLLLERKEESSAEKYTSAISELEGEARNSYATHVGLNKAKFIEMLILDGCFIIELVRKCSKLDSTCRNDPIFQMGWIINRMQRDLILFENQIPFFVLCKLFDLIEGPNQHGLLINLLLSFFEKLCPIVGLKRKDQTTMTSPRDIKHLLDLIHSSWQPPCSSHNVIVADHTKEEEEDAMNIKKERRVIPSAAELKHANVKFKSMAAGTCDILFEVKFDNGTIWLPPLTIDDRMEDIFRNLIAYEQFFPNARQRYVTDYVTFLDGLINTAKDVDILDRCGIIQGWKELDKEGIANIFNHFTDSVVGAGQYFSYGETFRSINTHYKKFSINKLIKVFKRNYLSGRWVHISVVAASLLLLLTVVQTVCSILQVVKYS